MYNKKNKNDIKINNNTTSFEKTFIFTLIFILAIIYSLIYRPDIYKSIISNLLKKKYL